MACFRFSMQNILNMKEKLEDQAKNKYAQANARLLREQEFVFEENRKEQKEVDELMSYKHGTKAV